MKGQNKNRHRQNQNTNSGKYEDRKEEKEHGAKQMKTKNRIKNR